MNKLTLPLAFQLFVFLACRSGSTQAPINIDTLASIPPDSTILSDTVAGSTSPEITEISVCSFNIKFVGLYSKKDHAALADILKGYDVVLIQELVSPPVDGIFPDGTAYTADPEARLFVDAMVSKGFRYSLSNEDTGTGDVIHNNGSATEWFIAFYKPEVVVVASDLPNTFLADDRSNHPDYERVPYAFSFRTLDNGLDFTIVSVHLKPDSGPTARARREQELNAIEAWINTGNQVEKDFMIAGDMNIYTQAEVLANLPAGYRSLNEQCLPTTVTGEGKPYDQVFYSEAHTLGDLKGDFTVVNLAEVMRPYWTSTEPYPINNSNLFFQYYSDHNPVVFTMISDGVDED